MHSETKLNRTLKAVLLTLLGLPILAAAAGVALGPLVLHPIRLAELDACTKPWVGVEHITKVNTKL